MTRTKTTTAPLVFPPAHRAPLVAGVAGGVGTTTLATILGCTDLGVHRPGVSVDLLVCRATASSLAGALTAVQSAPGRPVLVVVADTDAPPARTAAARMRMVTAHTSAVITLPWVGRLRELDHPATDLAAAVRGADTPKWAQPARVAVTELLTALAPLLIAPDPNHRHPPPHPPRPAYVPRAGPHPPPPPQQPPRGVTGSPMFHHH